ncbi:MAG: hypothetical protein Kow0029_03540 [Candidatus Rifleibacteriota bacterium]
MINEERFVLPFKWREFGKWFSTLGVINDQGDPILKIREIFFEAGEKRLEGIKIKVSFRGIEKKPKDFYLVAFLADMISLTLFEPIVGTPADFPEIGLSGKYVKSLSYEAIDLELFIPDQGWILPSIWRFLIQGMGLRRKDDARMPEIIVFAFESGNPKPIAFASKVFDYFGNARKLREDLALRDFFRLLNVHPDAPEHEIQRAYVARCREFHAEVGQNYSQEVIRRRNSVFSRIRNGYQLWSDKLKTNSKKLIGG